MPTESSRRNLGSLEVVMLWLGLLWHRSWRWKYDFHILNYGWAAFTFTKTTNVMSCEKCELLQHLVGQPSEVAPLYGDNFVFIIQANKALTKSLWQIYTYVYVKNVCVFLSFCSYARHFPCTFQMWRWAAGSQPEIQFTSQHHHTDDGEPLWTSPGCRGELFRKPMLL